MRRRTRWAMFVVAVIIFCAASYFAIRYADGYIWDFQAGHFVRTGAVRVGVNTDDVGLYVDDRLVASSSLLNRSIGSDGLSPGAHIVRLVKDGWSPWHKIATVTPGLLTDFPAVLLVPTDDDSLAQLRIEASRSFAGAHTLAEAAKPAKKGVAPEVVVNDFLLQNDSLFDLQAVASRSPIATSVQGFAITNDRSHVLWWTRTELWALWTKSTNEQPFRTEGETELVSRWSSSIRRAAWFRDEDHIVVDLGTAGFRIVETDLRGGINVIRF